MTNTYTEPVSKLLTFGEMDWSEWDDYSEFGFTKEHIPELIRLGTDRDLLTDIEGVDEDEMWAPMHAWRILVQMQAVEAIAPLAQVLDWSEESDGDLINEGLTTAFETFGPPVIEPLAAFINEVGHTVFGYISASEVMAHVAVEYPEYRDRVIKIISSALDAYHERNDEDVNGFWLADLLDLNAVDSYPIIKRAFEAGKINVRIAGDLEDVELEFGMREKRDTPAPNFPLPFDFMRPIPELDTKSHKKKEKSKRKQEKRSRKKNRKRK